MSSAPPASHPPSWLSQPRLPQPRPAAGRWELVLAHQDRLRRLVRARLYDPQDVEDCVHETLVRAACFAGLDESRVGAFLTTTALRLCVDHHRGRQRQHRLHIRVAALGPAPGHEDAVCDRQLGSWLLVQVRRLPERERQVLLARASGMSTAEAAVRFRISPKAAEGAFTRGRARLRRLCEQGEQREQAVGSGCGSC
jgi:RNA polymerase sigma factor (sigma-70 family)